EHEPDRGRRPGDDVYPDGADDPDDPDRDAPREWGRLDQYVYSVHDLAAERCLDLPDRDADPEPDHLVDLCAAPGAERRNGGLGWNAAEERYRGREPHPAALGAADHRPSLPLPEREQPQRRDADLLHSD